MTDRPTFVREALGLFAFLALCAAVFIVLWRFGGGDVNPLSDPYRVQVSVPTAVALAGNADVRQAGVRIGKVAGIALRGDRAVLMLELGGDHAPAYRDATVRVRAKTLSGENYVALDPGTPAAGRIASGGSLPLDRAGTTVQLDEILSSLDRERRRSLQRVIDGVGGGLDGRGEDLNRFLEATSAAVRESAPVNDVLAADRAQVAALVDDVGRVTRALGARREAIGVLARQGRRLGEAVAARDDRLRETLVEMPGFLRQAQGTAVALRGTARTATPVIGDLADATAALVPAVRALRPAAAQARRTMGALAGFADQATPLVTDLRPFATAARDLTSPLESVLREANPLVGYLSPYWQDLGGLLGILRNGQEAHDALGHYGRVVGLVSKSSVFGVLTPEQETAYQQLVKGGVLEALDRRGHNSHPKPGTVAAPVPFTGAYPRLERDPPYRP